MWPTLGCGERVGKDEAREVAWRHINWCLESQAKGLFLQTPNRVWPCSVGKGHGQDGAVDKSVAAAQKTDKMRPREGSRERSSIFKMMVA